ARGGAGRAFVRGAGPGGLIRLKRNIEPAAQVAALIGSFRETGGAQARVLADQGGGRVQRLGPPHWPSYPPAAVYGGLYDRDRAAGLAAARLRAPLIAADLRRLGLGGDCLPGARVAAPGFDPIIGGRAHGRTARQDAARG